MRRVIKQHVHGRLFVEEERATLFLADLEPASATDRSIYLCFAFPFQGSEEPILPMLVLDDWGGELRGLGLYEWVREFGAQFPRAELFGFDLSGRERQCFLRELELHSRLPCFAYHSKDLPLSQGILVKAVCLPEASGSAPRRIQPPPDAKPPLRWASASWWAVDSQAVASGTPPEGMRPN